MLTFLNDLRDVTAISILFRLLLGVLLGFAIGLERSYKNRPAGFRTHMLVCIAGTIASTVGVYLYLNLHLPTDIGRIGGQIISGLGFLCAGTILVTKSNIVRGLTTAAGLWATGVIGVAVGSGFYEGAVLTAAMVLLAETLFSRLATKIQHPPQFMLLVQYREKTVLDEVMRYSKDKEFSITNLAVTTESSLEEAQYSALISLCGRTAGIDVDAFMEHLHTFKGILSIEKV